MKELHLGKKIRVSIFTASIVYVAAVAWILTLDWGLGIAVVLAMQANNAMLELMRVRNEETL